ncbi:hypothetical protein V1460_06415 [Streptomyces sp. SCSIO 30461]|uniref:hypothetical protein n=1 Tax=Streptomyces sp. SCSIO 30461 TaxID=3118085 RepID=UPI0030D416A5
MTAADLPIGSLFSEVGGLDSEVQAALGGHVSWHAETDPHAARVLTRYWPRTLNLGDVCAIDWSQAPGVCPDRWIPLPGPLDRRPPHRTRHRPPRYGTWLGDGR